MTHFRDKCTECGRIVRQCRCMSESKVTNDVICSDCRRKSETIAPTDESFHGPKAKLNPNLLPTVAFRPSKVLLEDLNERLHDLQYNARLDETVSVYLEKRAQDVEDEVARQLMELGWTPPRDSRWYKELEFVDNTFKMLIDGQVYTFGLVPDKNREKDTNEDD